jgi:hypothetical protein
MSEQKQKPLWGQMQILKAKSLIRAIAYYLKHNAKTDIVLIFSDDRKMFVFDASQGKHIAVTYPCFPVSGYRIIRRYYKAFYSCRLRERGILQ